jgi:serine/threonine-protein kinase RsbW
MRLGSELVEVLLDAMRSWEWPEFEILRVQLAYEEAITNAIRHGNRHSPDKTVDVEFECDMDHVLVRIADQGEGFDPKAVPDPRDEDLLEVPGGRGVLMINELMTHVHYNSRGNQLEMEKIRGADEDLEEGNE